MTTTSRETTAPQPLAGARKTHLDALATTLLLACCLCWGFQQALSKATLAEVAPLYQALWRFALGSGALLLWCRWRGIPLAAPGTAPRGSWRYGLLAGALFGGEFICLFLGLQYTSAARVTMFLYCSPFWVAVVLPLLVPSERLRRVQWLGLGGALVGVALALADRSGTAAMPGAWRGDLLGLLAGLLWALTTVVLRATPLGQVRAETQLLYQMGVACLLLVPGSLLMGERWHLDFSAFAWTSLWVQGLIGGFVSYLIWVWLLGRYPATRMSSFVFLTPVFTLVVGSLWLGEPVTATLVGALVLVALGIWLVNRR